MSTLETNLIQPATGTTLTVGASGDTITVPSGATINLSAATQTGVGGANTPAFQATKSSSQTVSHATTTKITFDTETFDTNNAFASSKFTVPSGQNGNYYIYNLLLASRSTDSDMYRLKSMLYKNGSQVQEVGLNLAGTDGRDLLVNLIISMSLSVGDYLEIYTNTASSSTSSISIIGGSTITSVFGAYKLIT